ncbi:MAG: carboxypeptidase regulatory-like domain-containing protein [Bryobacteraceae bacterium]
MLSLAQQDMGVITGVVTDTSGAAVPGAKVVVLNPQTNELRNVVTSETGSYTVGPLRIGVYDVTIEHEGFKSVVRRGIELHAQDRARADFQLEVGQITESIAVTAEAALLQAETSSLDKVVNQREIRELPLNGRNFQQLAWLTSGVAPATRSRDRDSGFNAHGQPATQNNFIIDGVDNNNNVMGMQDRKAQVVIPSLDAVAEFKVLTSNYSAEFGRNSGAVMIVSIKSGTNGFHGSVYDYMRNDVFDSRDMFNYVDRNGDGKADAEVLRKQQFGGTLGGPILRDRTFFFGSWEGRRERRAQSDTGTVPNAEERQGIFSPSLAIIRDPLTRQPFPGNRVPRERWDPVAAKVLELWPQPNFTGFGTRNNYMRNPPWRADRDQYDGRVDHNLTNSDKIFARVSLHRYDNLREGVFPGIARGDQGNERSRDKDAARSAAFSYTRILTPTLLNEFRYGFIRQKVDRRELVDEKLSEVTARYGILGIPDNGRLFGLPRIALGGGIGYTGLGEGGSMPNFKIHQVHQYLDNFSWNRGNHNFKFGTDLRWNRSDIFGGGTTHGNFTFDGQFTGISLADYLLGMTSSAQLSSLLIGNMRFRNYMWYAQDDWKATPRLTVNLGLRYELTTPWVEKHDNQNTLDLSPGENFGRILKAGWCGDSWSCRGLVEFDKNNWAPRLGLAYQLSGRTVIRAGAGVFYGGQGSLGASDRMVNNFPFNRSVTVQSTTAAPALVLSKGFPAGFLGDPNAAPPENLNWVVWQPRFPEPTVYQWNLAVQREVTRTLSVTTAYVGSSSNYIMDSYNWNGSPPGTPATERQRRKIPKWNNISLPSPYAHSSYHGLDVQVDQRFARGFSLSAAYTWSHSLDNTSEQFGSGGGGLQDVRNFDSARANSNFDVRHRYVMSSVYELPFKGRLFGGWQVSGLISAQTGHYFSLTVAQARQRLGATGIGDWWPDRLASGRLDNRTTDAWFDKTAFVLPRAADGSWHFGNAGRSILNADGPFNMDFGVMKAIPITERVRAQFRWEVFNLTNSPTLADPVVSMDNPDFGKVRGTVSDPRQMQFALRVTF